MSKASDTREEVLEILRAMPGATAVDVYDLMPHSSKAVVSGMLHYLKKTGQIITDSKSAAKVSGGVRRMLQYRISDNPVPLAPKIKTKQPTEAGLQARLDEAHGKIVVLQLWKEEAIRRFPDLAVPPALLKARQLVADEFRNGGDKLIADEIIAGHKDNIVPIRVALKALEVANV